MVVDAGSGGPAPKFRTTVEAPTPVSVALPAGNLRSNHLDSPNSEGSTDLRAWASSLAISYSDPGKCHFLSQRCTPKTRICPWNACHGTTTVCVMRRRTVPRRLRGEVGIHRRDEQRGGRGCLRVPRAARRKAREDGSADCSESPGKPGE